MLNSIEFSLNVLLKKEPKKELGAVLRTYTLPSVEFIRFKSQEIKVISMVYFYNGRSH